MSVTTIRDLPMDVWTRVAVHVPFGLRIRCFHALRRAGCISHTRTTTSRALLDFCADADRAERDAVTREIDARGDVDVHILVEMGFPESDVRHALAFADGSVDYAVQYLLSSSM